MDSGLDTIYLIDDDETDIELVLRTIRSHAPSLNVVAAHNGVDALDMLLHPGTDGSPQRDMHLKLILLDLHMPGIDGFDVLTRLRSEPATQLLPVVVFSSSREPKDVERCFRLGANSFVVKPISMDRFEDVVWNIVQYWWLYNESMVGPRQVSAVHQ